MESTQAKILNGAELVTGRNNRVFTGKGSSLSLLDKLVTEGAGLEKTPVVKRDRKMIELERGLVKLGRMNDSGWEGRYRNACKIAGTMDYSAKDVEMYSLHLVSDGAEGLWDSAGSYLSALVNKGKDKEYVIRLIDSRLGLVGWKNCKRLTIKGNAGVSTGRMMRSGLIIVEGDVGNYAGSDMTGGKLAVLGNAAVGLGDEMKGGKIILNGNAKELLGNSMRGGYIHVKGYGGSNIGDSMTGGTIWVEKWGRGGNSSHSNYICRGVICYGKGEKFGAAMHENYEARQEQMKQPRE